MHLPKESTSIFDIHKALRKTSLRMIVMRKSVRHARVPLHCDIISSILHKQTIKFPFITFKIKLGRDNVCLCKVFEWRSKNWCTDPLLRKYPLLYVWMDLSMLSKVLVQEEGEERSYRHRRQANTSETIALSPRAPMAHRDIVRHFHRGRYPHSNLLF
jgi:hypothetical protein